jgi:hypothetical protein
LILAMLPWAGYFWSCRASWPGMTQSGLPLASLIMRSWFNIRRMIRIRESSSGFQLGKISTHIFVPETSMIYCTVTEITVECWTTPDVPVTVTV